MYLKKIPSMMSLCLLGLLGCNSENNKEPIQPENVFVEKESVAAQLEQLKQQGYQTFEYIDEDSGDTIIMQQYYMAFLMRGENTSQSEEELTNLQSAHLAHLSRMYEEGYADISGPFGDDGDMRGVTIYNVPNLAMADSLAHLDPMVKAGRLRIEIKPWWAGKGYPLR